MQPESVLPASCRLRVFLHGPLSVSKRASDGSWKPVAWGQSRIARSVFRRLLAAPGRHLSRGQLADDLWPASDFEAADSSLQTAISLLRSAIGKDLITTWDGGYEVANQTLVWVDLDACATLLKVAENQGCTTLVALSHLEEALSYFERGKCLEDEYETWCYAVRADAERMQRQCRMWLAEGYEQRGKLWQAGEQYRILTHAMPPDEEALQGWIQMLARHEKIQEALKCYQDTRSFAETQGFMLSSSIEQFITTVEQGRMGNNQTVGPDQDLEEQNMGLSRRNFLYLLGASGVEASLIASPSLQTKFTKPLSRLNDASIRELATITAHFRALHLQGDVPISHELFAHLSVIQSALNITMDDRQRHNLWQILAQTQLLCRFSLSRRNIIKAKTFNEAAIASARNSGDMVLAGAAIGHLAHFYLRIERAPGKALQLLDEAQTYIQRERALAGWFALLSASLAATEGHRANCEKHIYTALETAHDTQEIIDPYFTDFSITSVNAFAGNCLLTAEQPQKASEWLTRVTIEDLSPNRHASAYYDIARAYVASEQLEAAQEYALKSIDCAVATDNLYIIPRFIRLASTIQQKYPRSIYASSIVEYALSVL